MTGYSMKGGTVKWPETKNYCCQLKDELRFIDRNATKIKNGVYGIGFDLNYLTRNKNFILTRAPPHTHSTIATYLLLPRN